MTQRRLTVKGQGPEAHVTFSIEVYKGKVWVSSFDCPSTCDAILEPAQADSLSELWGLSVSKIHPRRKTSVRRRVVRDHHVFAIIADASRHRGSR